MKRISAFRIAATYAGCVLGAGFVSGQELWQFFGAHGAWGLAGATLALVLFFAVGVFLLGFARDSGISAVDLLIVGKDAPILRAAVLLFEGLFLLVIYILMAAAAGALFADLFGISAVWGSALLCVLVTLLSLSGVEGLVRVFARLVPLLVVATFTVSLLVLLTGGAPDPTPEPPVHIGGSFWWLDAAVYVNFNIVCSIPILAPLAQKGADSKTVRRGVLLACLALGAIAVPILCALSTNHALTASALPMLELALATNRTVGLVYAALLFGGIFGTALSTESALNAYLLDRVPAARRAALPITAAVSLLAFLAGQLGFRDLVSVLYPVFGYLGVIPLLLLLAHARRFYRQKGRGIQ